MGNTQKDATVLAPARLAALRASTPRVITRITIVRQVILAVAAQMLAIFGTLCHHIALTFRNRVAPAARALLARAGQAPAGRAARAMMARAARRPAAQAAGAAAAGIASAITGQLARIGRALPARARIPAAVTGALAVAVVAAVVAASLGGSAASVSAAQSLTAQARAAGAAPATRQQIAALAEPNQNARPVGQQAPGHAPAAPAPDRHAAVRHAVVRHAVVRHAVVRHAVVRHAVVRHAVVRHVAARPKRARTVSAAHAPARPASRSHASVASKRVQHARPVKHVRPAENLSSWRAITEAAAGHPRGGLGPRQRLLPAGLYGAQASMPLTPARAANAALITRQALRLHLGIRSAVIAVATAMQESTLENLSYGDRDSLGLFQQRPSAGWGSPAQITDPVYAADAFLHALASYQASDPGWASQPLWQAAQGVQRSGFPTAYAQWEDQAAHIVATATRHLL
jgi:hypothetical protein